MIRDYRDTDLTSIYEIGKRIKEDFQNVNNLEDLNNNYANLYVYEENGRILGFLHYENHFEITDILNIAVLKEEEGRGIGSQLLNHLIEKTSSDKIMLEVREGNEKAIKFYQKNGFKAIHVRKKYYGTEDAIIMERSKL